MRRRTLHSHRLQKFAVATEHNGEVGVRAWMRKVRIVAKVELEPVRFLLPHPSEAKPEHGIASFLRAWSETPGGAVFERDDEIHGFIS